MPVEPLPFRYRAFISYSHRDAEWGTWLHRALERYRIPHRLVGRTTAAGVVPARISPVFRDREELPSATSLNRTITAALEQSAVLIVICSPNSAQSRWVNEEIRTFQRLGRAEQVFCLIIGGEPGGPPGEECFPPALLTPLDSAGGPAPDPIAADARLGKDGRTGALLKLVAGIIGVGLDDLVRREQQRRQRRLVAITTAAIAGMAVTSTLAALAFLARNEAERERERAEVEAATAQQTADFLVNLFEVADPSEARGNSITAREILDRGAMRIDRDLADQPRIRVGLLDTMGRVYTGLGLYEPATDLLARAFEIRQQLQSAPTDDSVAIANALGFALSMKGDWDGASRSYEEALATAAALHSGDHPLVSEALNGIAVIALERGDFVESERRYDAALAMDRRLHGTEPHADVGRSLSGLARALMFQQRFDESEAAYREALSIRRQALGDEHPLVAGTLNDLGSMLYFASRPQAAETVFREAADIWRRIMGPEHPYVSDAENNLGRLLLERGELHDAEALLIDALAIDRKRNAGNDTIVYTLNNLGLTRLGLNDVPAALALFEEALEVAKIREHFVMMGEVAANLADVYWRLGRTAEAGESLAAARSAFAAVQPDERTYDANLDSIEGALLVAERRLTEAEPLLTSSYATLTDVWGPRGLFPRLAATRVAALHDARGERARAQALRDLGAAQ
jgi:tetratricopeptide (TPR) repeat protein